MWIRVLWSKPAVSKVETAVCWKSPPPPGLYLLSRATLFYTQSGHRDTLGSHIYCPMSQLTLQQGVPAYATSQGIPVPRLGGEWSRSVAERLLREKALARYWIQLESDETGLNQYLKYKWNQQDLFLSKHASDQVDTYTYVPPIENMSNHKQFLLCCVKLL